MTYEQQQSFTFQGWSGGEYGNLHPREAGRGKEMFHANNLVRNRSGLMIPRAGMRSLGVTGLPNGVIQAGGGGSDGQWALIGSTIYYFNPTVAAGAATAYTMTNSVTDTPTVPMEVAGAFTQSWLFVYGLNVYHLDHSTHTCALEAGGADGPPPPGRVVGFYQDRMIVGGTVANPSRLFWSDPGALGWHNFPPGNYLDLFNLGSITSLDAYRSGLMVGGSSNAYTYITGVLGASEVVKTVTYQGAPADPTKRALLATNEILYMANQRPYVETFNGAITTPMPTLTFAARNYVADSGAKAAYRLMKLIGPDDWIAMSGLGGSYSFAAQQAALLHYEGISTYQHWEVGIQAWAWTLGDGTQIFGLDGDGSHPPKFYWWTTELDRPAFNTDTRAQPGDGTDVCLGYGSGVGTSLWLPQIFPDDGSELTVHAVIVDFRKWNTGASSTKHFDVTVYAVNRSGTMDAFVTDPLASATKSFDEATTAPAMLEDGVDVRLRFGFGDQGSSAGFEVHLDQVRNVGIRSVTVLYQQDPPRG